MLKKDIGVFFARVCSVVSRWINWMLKTGATILSGFGRVGRIRAEARHGDVTVRYRLRCISTNLWSIFDISPSSIRSSPHLLERDKASAPDLLLLVSRLAPADPLCPATLFLPPMFPTYVPGDFIVQGLMPPIHFFTF